jgi:hypothetical protein
MGISNDDADRVMMNCCLYDHTAATLASSFKASSCAVSRGCYCTAPLEDTGSMAVLVDPMIGAQLLLVCKTLMQPAAAGRHETPRGIQIHWDFAAGLRRGCGSL